MYMYAVAIALSLLVVLCSLTSWCQVSACWAVHSAHGQF